MVVSNSSTVQRAVEVAKVLGAALTQEDAEVARAASALHTAAAVAHQSLTDAHHDLKLLANASAVVALELDTSLENLKRLEERV